MFTSRLIITAFILATSAVFTADLNAQNTAASHMARAVEAEETAGDLKAARVHWVTVIAAQDATPAQVAKAKAAIARLDQKIQEQEGRAVSPPITMEQLHTWLEQNKRDQILSLGSDAGPLLLDYVLNNPVTSSGKLKRHQRALSLLLRLPSRVIVSSIEKQVVDERMNWGLECLREFEGLTSEQGRPWRLLLTRAAGDPEAEWRRTVARCFAVHTPIGQGAWQALLGDQDERVQLEALNSLMKNAELSLDEIDQQLPLVLKSPFVSVRAALAHLLGEFGARTWPQAVAQIPALLRDSSAAVRLRVVNTAQQNPGSGSWTASDFELSLKDSATEVRKATLGLMVRLDYSASLQHLLNALSDDSSDVAEYAIRTLVTWHPVVGYVKSSVAQGHFIALLDRIRGEARQHAITLIALGGLDEGQALMSRFAQSAIPKEQYAAANYAMARNELPLNGDWPRLVQLFSRNKFSIRRSGALKGMANWCQLSGTDRLISWLAQRGDAQGLLGISGAMLKEKNYGSSLLGQALMNGLGAKDVKALQGNLQGARYTNQLGNLFRVGQTDFFRWFSTQPGSVEVYRAWLSSDEVNLRELAAPGLQVVGGPSDVPALLDSCLQDVDRWSIYTQAIRKHATAEHASAIGNAFMATRNKELRTRLYYTLDEIPGAAADAEILRIGKSGRTWKKAAAKSIGDRGIKAALPELIAEVRSGLWIVDDRQNFIRSIGKVGSIEQVDFLLADHLEKDSYSRSGKKFPILRERGADPIPYQPGCHAAAIFELGEAAVIDAISKIYDDPKSVKLLADLITTLAYVEHAEAIGYALKALSHPNGRVRSRAAGVAGHRLLSKATKRLRVLLRDPDAATAANSALLRMQDLAK